MTSLSFSAVCSGLRAHPNTNTMGRNKRAPVRGLFVVRRISTTSSLCPGFSGRGRLRENVLEPRVAAEGSEVGIALDLGGAIAAGDRALEEPECFLALAEDCGHDGGALQHVGVVRGEHERPLDVLPRASLLAETRPAARERRERRGVARADAELFLAEGHGGAIGLRGTFRLTRRPRERVSQVGAVLEILRRERDRLFDARGGLLVAPEEVKARAKVRQRVVRRLDFDRLLQGCARFLEAVEPHVGGAEVGMEGGTLGVQGDGLLEGLDRLVVLRRGDIEGAELVEAPPERGPERDAVQVDAFRFGQVSGFLERLAEGRDRLGGIRLHLERLADLPDGLLRPSGEGEELSARHAHLGVRWVEGGGALDGLPRPLGHRAVLRVAVGSEERAPQRGLNEGGGGPTRNLREEVDRALQGLRVVIPLKRAERLQVLYLLLGSLEAGVARRRGSLCRADAE